MQDLVTFHNNFYKYPSKETQDAFLLNCCVPKKPTRKRPRKGNHKSKKFQTEFNVYSMMQKKKIRVCQTAFLGILHITKHRVQYIAKSFMESGGQVVKEKRGGDRKTIKFAEKKKAVMLFINMFYVDEPHYCRGHSERRYLPAELSINKIWKMYNKQVGLEEDLKVKKGYFRRIFNTNYNLGFGSPRTDVCSFCLRLIEQIKRERDETAKQRLRVEWRVHKLKAKAFFALVKEEQADLKTLSFDCQKNLPLPKTPDQITYYSRQVYLYNCTVVEGSSKSPLTPENVFAYCWTEDEYAKGANEIASIIYHRLRNTDFTGISTIRLIADGCPGQNKNSIMLTMCSKWLVTSAPNNVQEIQIVFPVVGHSFIPPDRVFAHAEKESRKLECIITPENYLDIIGAHSTIVRLGTDCEVFNFKKSMATTMKDVGSWHFQFKKCKRFFIKRSFKPGNVVINGEVNFNNREGVFKKVTRKNKNVCDINPDAIEMKSVKLKPAKLVDVKKLLCCHFGEDWENQEGLGFYKNILQAPTEEEEENDSSEAFCERRTEENCFI